MKIKIFYGRTFFVSKDHKLVFVPHKIQRKLKVDHVICVWTFNERQMLSKRYHLNLRKHISFFQWPQIGSKLDCHDVVLYFEIVL